MLGRRRYDSLFPKVLLLQIGMLLVLWGVNVWYLSRIAVANQQINIRADQMDKALNEFYSFLKSLGYKVVQ